MTKKCPLTYTHIEIKTDGNLSPCCEYKGNILDSNNNTMNIRKYNISDAINSDYMTQLRNDLDSGIERPECQRCWIQEHNNGKSRRLIETVRFNKYLDLEKPILKSIDLKLGNLCNLRCRICSSVSSSSWAIDEDNKSLAKFRNKLGKWPEEIDFDSTLDGIIDSLELLEIYGGEPFMVQQHEHILQKCIDSGSSKNITLKYSTNGTIYPEKLVPLWDKFKEVNLLISIDDLYQRFEYQRYPAKWGAVVENIKQFTAIPNVKVIISPTISIFNVYYIPDLFNWFTSMYHTEYYLNLLTWPDYFSIKNLPQSVSEKVLEKWEDWTYTGQGPESSNIQMAKKILKNNRGTLHPDFWTQIMDIDLRRKQQFKNVYPDWYDILKEK